MKSWRGSQVFQARQSNEGAGTWRANLANWKRNVNGEKGRAQKRRKKDPELIPRLMGIVEPHTAGEPTGDKSRWLNCRLQDVQGRLRELGHEVSRPVISRLLKAVGYSLRLNVKEREGEAHPDRDTQFRYIRQQRAAHQQAGHPTLSLDTKKKELVGNFKNGGRIWCQ